MKRIYVGNLSFQCTEQDLEELFAQHGTVSSVDIIRDRDTGRSRGFGFVEMENDSEAQAAIDKLNGTTLHDRALNVNEARERRGRGGGGFDRGR